MAELFSALINHSFMQHAVIACILSSIGCGIIGTYVVVKKMSFLAGGIAHTALAGIGMSHFFGGSALLGAMIAAIFAAVTISLIKLYWRQQEDILVAGFWSVGMAIGILFVSRTPSYSVDLMSFLFGNILLVSRNDLLIMAILDGIILITVALLYKQFMVIIFDPEFAQLRGLRVGIYYTLLMCMIALTVVLLIQIVGLILVIALLIFPAAFASQFFHSIFKIMLAAIIICIVITLSGLTISYQPNLPVGATIILVAGAFYILSIAAKNIFRRSHIISSTDTKAK